MHIRHLREKIEVDAKEPEYIFTVRGVGYRFRDTARSEPLPHPLRSLRNRLTLIFALIVAGAIAIVYFYVTPRLEEELVTQKLERLAAEAQTDVGPLSRIVGLQGVPQDESSGPRTTRPPAPAPR